MTKTLHTIFFIFIVILFFSKNSYTIEPEEFLQNPKQEMRARDISKNIRCLVCQNQSIDDSDATLARDLRSLVRERLVQGDTDLEVIDYVVSRYGDFVLLRPPVKEVTILLWLGPIVFALIGLFGLIRFFRHQSALTKNED